MPRQRPPYAPPPSAGGVLLGRGEHGTVPLSRGLSKLGICSREEAARRIIEGRVSVDGAIVRDPASPIMLSRADLRLDGQPLAAAAPRLLLLYKPRGVVTTRSDEAGRPTVYGLLPPEVGWLVPVGRLDLATSGLLLLTNDTHLADALTDPANGVPRVYVATVRGAVEAAAVARMRTGIDDGGERLAADDVSVDKRSGRESRLRLTLREGKNREVRRLCAAVGHPVTRLLRVAYGGLTLEGLQPGQWRELAIAEGWACVPGSLRRAPATQPRR